MKPLVSCICPTQDRRIFLRQSIGYFINAANECGFPVELVIVDASENKNLDYSLAYEDLGIRYYHAPELSKLTGSMHNRCCELAQGEIIIQWDDDDWQSPSRIHKQVKALNGDNVFSSIEEPSLYKPALALTSHYYGYHLAEKKAFRSRCWGAGLGSLGSAFAFHRKVWEKVPFADVKIASDQIFFEACQKENVPIIDMQDPNYFVYIRHNQNVSPHSNDLFDAQATEEATRILGDDIDFYDELSEILPLAQWNHPKTFGQYGIYKRNPLDIARQARQDAGILADLRSNRSKGYFGPTKT